MRPDALRLSLKAFEAQKLVLERVFNKEAAYATCASRHVVFRATFSSTIAPGFTENDRAFCCWLGCCWAAVAGSTICLEGAIQ